MIEFRNLTKLRNVPPSATPDVAQAIGFIAAVALLFFYLGFPLQAGLGQGGLLLSEWLLLFLPALLFVRVAGVLSKPYAPRCATSLPTFCMISSMLRVFS